MTGSLDGSKRSSSGRFASSGSSSRSSFSRTSIPARSMSVPQTNSRITSDCPDRETERTWRTLRMIPTASSTGRVIRFSISSGAAPVSSVRTVSVGYERSGRRLSLSRDSDTSPKSAIATVHMTTVTRRRIAKSINCMMFPEEATALATGAAVQRDLTATAGASASVSTTLTSVPLFRPPWPTTTIRSSPLRPSVTSTQPPLTRPGLMRRCSALLPATTNTD